MPRRQANLSYNSSVGSKTFTDDLTVNDELTVSGTIEGNIYDRSSELYVLENLVTTQAGVLYSIPPTRGFPSCSECWRYWCSNTS